VRHVSDFLRFLRDKPNVTEGVIPRAEITAAAQAIFQSLESKHGTPLSSVDVQKQEAYRFAASAALHAAEIARGDYKRAS
jgi:hypothetical protein